MKKLEILAVFCVLGSNQPPKTQNPNEDFKGSQLWRTGTRNARAGSRLEARLDKTQGPIIGVRPIMAARNIDYEVSERTPAIPCGGIGVFHMLARKLGLIDAINDRLHLLKIHMPYHESDHVLNIAYNAL